MITRPPRILSHWKREKPKKAGGVPVRLSPLEQAHARNALRFVRQMYGSAERLAKALGVSRTTIAQSAGNNGVSLWLVRRISKLQGVGIDAILTGEWPTPRKCPTCGHDWEF